MGCAGHQGGQQDAEIAELCRRYAEHAPPGGFGAESPASAEAALVDAARAARALASCRVPGVPALQVRTRDRTSPVVEIITDDLPYLVESVLAGIARVGGRARQVLHPTVVVRRELTGELIELLVNEDPARPPPGALAEAWMHVELEPFPADELDDLAAELRQALSDIREVAEDRERMTKTALAVATELVARPPPLPEAEVRDAARLVEWLVDGHFTFLGYHRYRVERAGGTERVCPVLGSGLGVLRRDSLTTRRFVPPLYEGLSGWWSSPKPARRVECCARCTPTTWA